MANLQKTLFPIRLSKYLSLSGLCSRRKADDLIKAGAIKVNNQTIYDAFHRINESDIVLYNGKRIILGHSIEHFYIVLNKPKDYLVTRFDSSGRKNVFQLIENFDKNVRLFPVGRLDRNTTGILLLTNDGDFANKLMHPSSQIYKFYSITLDRNISTHDIHKLLDGVTLTDGISQFDEVDYPDFHVKNKLIVKLHSGKNRVIRRTFEELGYNVKYLDRISFAGIDKKNLKPGEWRYLNQQELNHLRSLFKH